MTICCFQVLEIVDSNADSEDCRFRRLQILKIADSGEMAYSGEIADSGEMADSGEIADS